MSIQILPREGTAASNIGAGLGQGLAQQLPEEIKRYRIKSGLESLANQKGNISSYSLIGQLASIPGLDPGLIGVLAPALQKELAYRQSIGEGEGEGEGQNESPISSTGEIPKGHVKVGSTYIPTRSLVGASPEFLEQQAKRLLANERFPYETIENARAHIDKLRTQQVSRLDTGREEYQKHLQAISNKPISELRGEIGPRTEQMMQERLDNKLLEGDGDTDKIAKQFAKQTDEIIQTKNKLRSFRYFPDVTGKKLKSNIQGIRELKNQYAKHGIPERDFRDDLVSQLGVSQSTASYISDPLSDSKVGSLFREIPKKSTLDKINMLTRGIPKGGPAKEKYSIDKVASEVASRITKNDLVGSIAYLARSKGFNWDELAPKVLDKINSMGKDISDEQRRDFADYNLVPRGRNALEDIWITRGER